MLTGGYTWNKSWSQSISMMGGVQTYSEVVLEYHSEVVLEYHGSVDGAASCKLWATIHSRMLRGCSSASRPLMRAGLKAVIA